MRLWVSRFTKLRSRVFQLIILCIGMYVGMLGFLFFINTMMGYNVATHRGASVSEALQLGLALFELSGIILFGIFVVVFLFSDNKFVYYFLNAYAIAIEYAIFDEWRSISNLIDDGFSGTKQFLLSGDLYSVSLAMAPIVFLAAIFLYNRWRHRS